MDGDRERNLSSFRDPTAGAAGFEIELLRQGDLIGPYEVAHHVGDGAFGEVYLARQHRPIERDVAIKLLKPGMDSRSVLSRFEAERQTLALMDHPGIATIHDAGVTERGRSYFVMEYINGTRIDRFCDDRRLSIRERVRLFREVCAAVHHAHRQGVIHRDLKPSNILVAIDDDEARPKVIDFGVAKAIDTVGDATQTEMGQFIGTPDYMAPEQTAGSSEIDVRADVYSLGVVLYLLLCGRVPFDPAALRQGGIDGIVSMVRDVVPPTPQQRFDAVTVDQQLTIAAERGVADGEGPLAIPRELGWIAMRCLEKEPERRYDNVRELARDLVRFETQQPVEAGPPSRRYRASVFVRRHRLAIAAIGAVVLTLAIGVIASTILGTRLARERAANRDARVETLIDQSHRLFYTHADGARTRLEEAVALAGDDPRPMIWLAVLETMAGRRAEAIAATRDVVRRFPDDPMGRGLLTGLVAGSDGSADLEVAIERHELDPVVLFAMSLGIEDDGRALELLDRSIELYPWSFLTVWQRSVRLYRMERFEEALADAEILTRIEPEKPLVWVLYGLRLAALDRLDESITSLTRAVELDGDDFTARFNLAWATTQAGEWSSALEHAQRAVELAPGDGEALELEARALMHLGRYDEAVIAYDGALGAGFDRWEVRLARAETLHFGGRSTEALDALAQVLPQIPTDAEDRWRALFRHGELLLVANRPGDAIGPLRDAAGLLADSSQWRPLVRLTLARALRQAGELDESIAMLEPLDTETSGSSMILERSIGSWRAGRIDDAVRDMKAYVRRERDQWVELWIWDALYRHRPRDAEAVLEALTRVDDDDLARLARYARRPDPDVEIAATVRDARRWDATYHAAVALGNAGMQDQATSLLRRYIDGTSVDQLEHELARWKLGAR